MNRQYSSKTALRILCALFVLISAAAAVAGPVDSVQAQAPAQQQAAGGVTDTWAVQISPGTDPDQLALQMGAQNLGQIGALTGYYLFRIPGTDSEVTAMADVFAASSQVVWFEQQVARQQTRRVIEDPVYLDQWHLVNAKVEPAWTAGFTGTGVNIAIVDDGLQHSHPDLIAQYKSVLSHDYNGDAPLFAEDGDPEDALGHQDYHGTASAGIAAADYNGNAFATSCGLGVAYDAGLSGLRLIAAPSTPDQVARALNFGMNPASPGADFNSIYNNSWGPADDMTEPLVGPDTLELAALQAGVTSGRNGKGSIYVWAAGNGLAFKDNVNYDGYANSRFTIAVGAVGNDDTQAPYSEPGAAMLVTAPGGISGPNGIVTTDLLGHFGYSFNTDCTEGNFDGTSASAPLVSGVVALMLDANPSLGWRDVQNILARTAAKNDSTDADWDANPNLAGVQNNGAGLHVNHKYGFGLVDAGAAVAMAADPLYKNLSLPSSVSSGSIIPDIDNQNIPDNVFVDGAYEGVFSTYNVSRDIMVEHVEVVFKSSENLNQLPPGTGGYRGDLRIVLTSPSGTVSVLSEPHGDSAPDYVNWKFMTVRNWGESSLGTWTLRVTDEKGGGVSVFDSWQLILHGTGKNTFADATKWTNSFDLSHGWTVADFVRTVGDVNGDGKADVVGFGLDGVYVATSTGIGFGPISRLSTSFDLSHSWTVKDFVRTLGDVNGDGLTDLVGFGLDGVYVSTSTGIGFDPISRWTTSFDLSHGWTVKDFVRTVGDVNGDGLADLVGFGLDGVYVSTSTGTGFDPISRWTTSFDLSHGWTVKDFVRTVGDVNGDGLADLIGFGLDGVYVATSTGSGFDPISRWTTSFDLSHGWTVKDFVRTVGDVNGDRLADLIGFGLDGVYVALSTGSGFEPISRWTNSFDLSHGWTVAQYARTVGDVNGDGLTDLIGFGLDGVYVGIAQ